MKLNMRRGLVALLATASVLTAALVVNTSQADDGKDDSCRQVQGKA